MDQRTLLTLCIFVTSLATVEGCSDQDGVQYCTKVYIIAGFFILCVGVVAALWIWQWRRAADAKEAAKETARQPATQLPATHHDPDSVVLPIGGTSAPLPVYNDSPPAPGIAPPEYNGIAPIPALQTAPCDAHSQV
eukprot:TRINITY_DN12751_c0_g1_i3.p2 TRINITY_DN12751_c0_g1~~TRINITY_DN12751_c0_g1_i3.p2  ORF type:complete len:136 (+),score=6.77 TRINITY_DN12751_c0_g1_i3:197-604(+)